MSRTYSGCPIRYGPQRDKEKKLLLTRTGQPGNPELMNRHNDAEPCKFIENPGLFPPTACGRCGEIITCLPLKER